MGLFHYMPASQLFKDQLEPLMVFLYFIQAFQLLHQCPLSLWSDIPVLQQIRPAFNQKMKRCLDKGRCAQICVGCWQNETLLTGSSKCYNTQVCVNLTSVYKKSMYFLLVRRTSLCLFTHLLFSSLRGLRFSVGCSIFISERHRTLDTNTNIRNGNVAVFIKSPSSHNNNSYEGSV